MHGLHASCHPPVKPGGSSHSQSGHGSSASPPKGAKKKKMVFSLRFFRPNGDTTGKAVLEVHRRNSKDVKQSVPLQPDGLASDEVDRSEVNAFRWELGCQSQELVSVTQRRQYSGHNTPLGYHTDQGT